MTSMTINELCNTLFDDTFELKKNNDEQTSSNFDTTKTNFNEKTVIDLRPFCSENYEEKKRSDCDSARIVLDSFPSKDYLRKKFDQKRYLVNEDVCFYEPHNDAPKLISEISLLRADLASVKSNEKLVNNNKNNDSKNDTSFNTYQKLVKLRQQKNGKQKKELKKPSTSYSDSSGFSFLRQYSQMNEEYLNLKNCKNYQELRLEGIRQAASSILTKKENSDLLSPSKVAKSSKNKQMRPEFFAHNSTPKRELLCKSAPKAYYLNHNKYEFVGIHRRLTAPSTNLDPTRRFQDFNPTIRNNLVERSKTTMSPQLNQQREAKSKVTTTPVVSIEPSFDHVQTNSNCAIPKYTRSYTNLHKAKYIKHFSNNLNVNLNRTNTYLQIFR
jgi:hypothetical protein